MNDIKMGTWWRRYGLILAACAVVYGFGLTVGYYADDFQFVFDPPGPHIVTGLTHPNPENSNIYRPLEASFLAAVQTAFGMQTWPIHVVQILLHAALATLVWAAMGRLGFSRTQGAAAAVFMVVSQANVHAVVSNDTFSQVAGTLCGWTSLYLLYRYLVERSLAPSAARRSQSVLFRMSLLFFAVSLFMKESSLAYLAVAGGLLLVSKSPIFRRATLREAAMRFVPYLVLVIAYLVVRAAVIEVQPALGEGRQDFSLGLNVVQNVGMLGFSSIVPVSTVYVYRAASTGDLTGVAVIAGLTLFFVLTILVGAWFSRRILPLLLFTAACIVVCFFPMALMNHVSELYAYNAIPFTAVLVGITVGRLVDVTRRRASRIPLYAVLGVLIASGLVSIESKIAMMRDCGRRADALLSQIEPYLARVPSGGTLYLVQTEGEEVEYSIFLMEDFNVLARGLHRLNQLAGREDFGTDIVDGLTEVPANGAALMLEGDRVVPAGGWGP